MNTATADSRSTRPMTIGRYEILTKLASGGMAEVYAARVGGTLGFSRLVAFKLLYPNLVHEEQFLSMFLDEARLAARIHHPNVVATLDVGDAPGGVPFLVMDYIEGDHLGQILGRAGGLGETLPIPVVLRIIIDSLNGLGAAHALRDERGELLHLVHRDISPHNIMVGCDGTARITDFGVAKAEDRLTQTRAGLVKGKLSYMAPEQASTGQTDSRSDLFSMGVVLWESLTGTRLFRGENAADTLNRILHAPTPAPSSVNPALAALDGILACALDRDPAQRFQTADAFVSELEEVAASVGGVASRRVVGAIIERLMHDKLARERALIGAASHGEVQVSDQDAVASVGSGARPIAVVAEPSHPPAASAATRPDVAVARRAALVADQESPPSVRPRLSSPLPAPSPLGALVTPPPPTQSSSTFSLAARATVLIVGLAMFAAMLWFTSRPRQEGPIVRSSGAAYLPPKDNTASHPQGISEVAKASDQEAKAAPALDNHAKGDSEGAVAASEEVDSKPPNATTVDRSSARENTVPRARLRQRSGFELYDNPYLRRAPEEQDAPPAPEAVVSAP